MFVHNKRLQYTIRVGETNPGLANLLLEQFGGPQGELAAACRYFNQSIAEFDPDRKDMLMDIATEELSHLEVIGNLVAMLNRGAKGSSREIRRPITGSIYPAATKVPGTTNPKRLFQFNFGRTLLGEATDGAGVIS